MVCLKEASTQDLSEFKTNMSLEARWKEAGSGKAGNVFFAANVALWVNYFVDSAWRGCWQRIWVVNATIWLRWASRHSRFDLERSSCWNVTWNLALIWNEAWNWEKFFVESSLSDLLSLTQISLALEMKFVESDDIILSLILNVLTLRANRLNKTWFCWAWLKSLLTLIENLLNVSPILFLEFCTIWLSIPKTDRKYSPANSYVFNMTNKLYHTIRAWAYQPVRINFQGWR